MTISEKVEQATKSTIFTLYKEGIFYKCYNEDAMLFVKKVRDYKISSKMIKSAGSKIYTIGYPSSIVENSRLGFEEISIKIGSTSYESKDDRIVFL